MTTILNAYRRSENSILKSELDVHVYYVSLLRRFPGGPPGPPPLAPPILTRGLCFGCFGGFGRDSSSSSFKTLEATALPLRLLFAWGPLVGAELGA
jgi:hypothetical protein